jgi:hypothetical protein
MTESTSYRTGRRRSKGLFQVTWTLAIGAVVCGCEPQSIQTIEGLTVIAVEATPPSANPGDTVDLELTLFDPLTLAPGDDSDGNRDAGTADGGTGDDDAEASDIVQPQIAWFGGCHNPPRESATGCLPLLSDAATSAVEILRGGDTSDLDPELLAQLGFGPRFRMQIPNESVADRKRRPELVPFGISYAFFGVCRGEFTLLPEARERLPIGCVDETGEEVDDEDFVIGFTTIYVYDEIESRSPEVRGVELDGERVKTAECSSDDDCSSLGKELHYACRQDRCLPRVPVCKGSCDTMTLAPIIDEDVGELDPTSVAIGQEPKRELVWVRYYAIGALDREESLIMDREGKLRTRFAADWTPPRRSGVVVPLFTVVQDSRGGTTPMRIDVLID